MLGFFIWGFVLNKIKIKQRVLKILKMTFLLTPLFTFCFLSIHYPVSEKLVFYFLQITVFPACAILRIFNKHGITYQISKIGLVITTIIVAATLFGSFIIGKIPAQYWRGNAYMKYLLF